MLRSFDVYESIREGLDHKPEMQRVRDPVARSLARFGESRRSNLSVLSSALPACGAYGPSTQGFRQES